MLWGKSVLGFWGIFLKIHKFQGSDFPLQKKRGNVCIYPEMKFQVNKDYLENKLLLISINFTPKTSHSCL